MAKIHVLDKAMAELIAAGEVIDRPASVVKELCENAVDAGARQITVELMHGGISYLRVTDDGSGIEREDIRNAFLRHATSKLQKPQDLEQILTMGFRGEALASIAAMCRVEVLTRTPGSACGTHYRIEGGQEMELSDAGCPVGTTMVVRDIFYNTPARMKFLKKDITEGNAVGGVVERMAAANPQIGFRLIKDGRAVLQTPGNGKLADAIYAIWGREFYSTLVPLSFENRGVRVRGMISKPSLGRGNRSMQHFFVNGRTIRSRTCMAALEEGYHSLIMKGKYPACVLNILLPPSVYDVNVHPAKLEVRFADEKLIFDSVYYGVKSALMGLDRQGVEAQLGGKKPLPTPFLLHQEVAQEGEALSLDDISRSSLSRHPTFGRENAERDRNIGKGQAPESRQIRPAGIPAENAVSTDAAGKCGDNSVLHSAAQQTAGWDRTRQFPRKEIAFSTNGPAKVDAETASASKRGGSSFPNLVKVNEKKGERKPEDGDGLSAFRLPLTMKEMSGVPDGEARQEETAAAEWKQKEQEDAKDTACPDTAEQDKQEGRSGRRYDGARLIGEVFRTYLLLESEDRLILIDKHAAHERLLYEKLRAHNEIQRQTLLTPVTVSLSREEYDVLMQNLPILGQMGFLAEDFGEGCVVIREIPTLLPLEEVAASIGEVAAKLAAGNRRPGLSVLDDIYHTIACKAAIKAHDETSREELLALIELLNTWEDVKFCPHGRPIATVLTRGQLERMFGRA